MEAIYPSVITSFDTTGILAGKQPIYKLLDAALSTDSGKSEIAIPIELYVSMEPDLFRIARSSNLLGRKRPLMTEDVLGGLSAIHLGKLTKEIVKKVGLHCGERPIIALATYIPEISKRNQATAGKSESALAGVIHLARLLRESSPLHKVFVVEAVAGSRFSTGVASNRSGGSNDDAKLNLNIELDEDHVVQDRVIERLENVVNEVTGVASKNEGWPTIALELEPGPFFVLRDFETLCQLAERIDRNKLLYDKVGFNMDISHWRIAGIGIQEIREHVAVADRIVHAHISGHHPHAHFGDSIPTERDWLAFEPWIELTMDLMSPIMQKRRIERALPQFSGFVSVELEASQHADHLIHVVNELNGRIQKVKALRTQSMR